MPRSTWNGTLSFGLIHLPVSLFTAVREQNVKFRQLCPVHRQPISMKRVCAGPPRADPAEAHEVAQADLVSGFEHAPGKFVVVTKEERAASPKGKSSFDVRLFVAKDSLDPRVFGKPYLVLPQKPESAKPYALLREALSRTAMTGIGLITLSKKEQMAAVRAEGDVVLLHVMHWPDELVDLGEFTLPGAEGLREAEVALAMQLVDSLSGALATADFRDGQRERLQRLIMARAEGEEVEPEIATASASTPVTDLVALLEASIAARKAA
jgi:DNA end-binding protein Ku